MANIKSARKRALTSEKRRLRNSMLKSRIRTAVRRFHEALAADNPEQIKQRLSSAFSIIDKAVVKGVIHKNKAARHKAQLSRKLNSVS
ncbi:MAG: 30S ribosomal protein S20 [Firmicutes bacterium]|nr:30S ribosomal protein S20 [Bacillota bacterium]